MASIFAIGAGDAVSLKDDCKCGHDRTQHFKHLTPDGFILCNCLAVRCECKAFQAPGDPDPPSIPPPPDTDPVFDPKVKPHADTTCSCSKCRDWEIKKWLAGA
jgi:hypothetical protein